MIQPLVEYLEHQIHPTLELRLWQNYVCVVWKKENKNQKAR